MLLTCSLNKINFVLEKLTVNYQATLSQILLILPYYFSPQTINIVNIVATYSLPQRRYIKTVCGAKDCMLFLHCMKEVCVL